MRSFSLLQRSLRSAEPLRTLTTLLRTPRNPEFLRKTAFSSSAYLQSGHSRWSKIKHDKGKADARRGANFSKISREIIEASRSSNGNLDNLRLVAAIAAAKKAGMLKSNIESAVKRGQGVSSEGTALETVLVEAMGPGSVALIVECLTGNKLRALQDIKHIITRNHAAVTPTSYLFSKKGLIWLSPGGKDFDSILESALEIEGTEDVEEVPVEEGEGKEIEIVTEPARVSAVAGELKKLSGVEVIRNAIEWVPNEDTMVEVKEGTKEETDLEILIDQLESSPEVNEVYTNIRT